MCETNSSNRKEKMMKMFIIAVLTAFCTIVCDGKTVRKVMVTDELLTALAQVESNNDNTKVGKLGELGILQIRECVIQDVNRIYKTKYVLNDAKDNEKAKDICRKYLQYWGKHYEKKTGLKATNQILSKIWNGGPTGPYKKTTYVIANLDKYWNKVKAQLG